MGGDEGDGGKIIDARTDRKGKEDGMVMSYRGDECVLMGGLNQTRYLYGKVDEPHQKKKKIQQVIQEFHLEMNHAVCNTAKRGRLSLSCNTTVHCALHNGHGS